MVAIEHPEISWGRKIGFSSLSGHGFQVCAVNAPQVIWTAFFRVQKLTFDEVAAGQNDLLAGFEGHIQPNQWP
jgi:hypothetical protein